MTRRLWYPQLDIYDCVRRMSALLSHTTKGMYQERLYILDFYLANPPLLHRTSMKSDVRSRFRSLRIEKPEKAFVAYPAAQLLFHQMEPIQKDGLGAMAGKGLISIKELKNRNIKFTENGKQVFDAGLHEHVTEEEKALTIFLVNSFGKEGDEGMRSLRAGTGLRRAN
ncbi:ABC-three component system middle component 5 [Roseibium album]|uniref:ABC-three component system middle component 5 n=1 Tax=Roseibium album TaxID=311410 RepID=UPI00329A1803